jgi:hypothetical protein
MNLRPWLGIAGSRSGYVSLATIHQATMTCPSASSLLASGRLKNATLRRFSTETSFGCFFLVKRTHRIGSRRTRPARTLGRTSTPAERVRARSLVQAVYQTD